MLIQQFIKKRGLRLAATEALGKLHERALEKIKRLPTPLRSLKHTPEYPVTVSNALLRPHLGSGHSSSRPPFVDYPGKPLCFSGKNDWRDEKGEAHVV
jgi:hypothetical protein